MTDPRYPALAEAADVEVRLERTFSGSEADRVDALLYSVSIKVRRVSGRLWLTLSNGVPVVPYVLDPAMPETVWDITVTAVERAIRNPDGYSSESSGDYSYQRVGIPGGVGGLYLTDDEVEALRQYGRSGTSGLWTLGTTRGEHEALGEDYFIDTSYNPIALTDELDGRLS